MRLPLTAFLLTFVSGCAEGTPDPLRPLSADSFVGVWRSVTESMEFIRLTVDSKSSARGEVGARLTFSGVAWEGSGRVDGDSLVAQMKLPGIAPGSRTFVARFGDGSTLNVVFYSPEANPLEITFVRDR